MPSLSRAVICAVPLPTFKLASGKVIAGGVPLGVVEARLLRLALFRGVVRSRVSAPALNVPAEVLNVERAVPAAL